LSSPFQGEGLGVRVGFVWTRQLDAHAGEIEPLGVRPAYQRQGYGRALLLAGLRQLAKRGAERAQLGVWVENTAAIHLYQSVGFQRLQTITYLALNL
ncbi:MAG: N-acetyltransferase, partial [Chloroflexota bacterium]